MTLSEAAAALLIRRPDEPAHAMRVKPVGQRVVVSYDGQILAESTRALRVIEFGRDVYDPVLYVPREDVLVELLDTDHETHCPLKGRSRYLSVRLPHGSIVERLAWSYHETYDFADILQGLVAFDASKVTVTESPA